MEKEFGYLAKERFATTFPFRIATRRRAIAVSRRVACLTPGGGSGGEASDFTTIAPCQGNKTMKSETNNVKGAYSEKLNLSIGTCHDEKELVLQS